MASSSSRPGTGITRAKSCWGPEGLMLTVKVVRLPWRTMAVRATS